MILLENKQDCCGCGACLQICPARCISMHTDDEGFAYPAVDAGSCVDCHLCEQVCPVIHQEEARLPLKVVAARNPDLKIRMQSSSGGIFTLLAGQTLDRGGVVFGARFDTDWSVVHDYTETREGLAAFRGSKYLQSRIGESFRQAERFLKTGREVLFTGTPCQIAGLKKYLRCAYDNLLTAEVVCHGAPSPQVWQEYLSEYAAQEHISRDEIRKISFRDKSKGWKRYGFTVEEGRRHTRPAAKDGFMRGFLADIYLRPSCYACPAKSLKSGSDITLGDFWGIDREMPDFDDDKGVSAVLLNTERGVEAFRSLAADTRESSFDVTVRHNPALVSDPLPTLKREVFYTSCKSGVSEAIDRLVRPYCILTQPLCTNYGGLLQAYALQTVLLRMGLDVLTEDRRPNRPNVRRRVKNRIKSKIETLLSRCSITFRFKRRWEISAADYAVISRETAQFVRKYIRTTVPVDSPRKKMLRRYDFRGYIVGSDQVWRPMYSPYLPNYFLDFTRGQDVRRVAYAASFGTDEWEYSPKQTRRCSSLIGHFDALSVREAGAVKVCREHLGAEPELVLDPTMLLEKEDYIALAESEGEVRSAGNLFCYILDPTEETDHTIRHMEQECAMTAFQVMPRRKATRENVENHLQDCVFPRVTQWLRAFMDAELVLTDSFHGCVFSIIFNKPFWVIGNRERGMSRFQSLLSMFGLEERMIDPQHLRQIDWRSAVDWVSVNERRKAWQKVSFDFLQRNLER